MTFAALALAAAFPGCSECGRVVDNDAEVDAFDVSDADAAVLDAPEEPDVSCVPTGQPATTNSVCCSGAGMSGPDGGFTCIYHCFEPGYAGNCNITPPWDYPCCDGGVCDEAGKCHWGDD